MEKKSSDKLGLLIRVQNTYILQGNPVFALGKLEVPNLAFQLGKKSLISILELL